ncbi:dynamin family protein [Longimicrobium sp.]|uniref:dynamin family protein n=1 Tax=Longimicrobium sp. TaxID=2029185 RepID=UPI002CA3A4DE|nr:dynamin family protein [Longimicrobium sp.]HSU16669.1 dynamin family protein [Longimicrobium sp.]
MIQRTSGTPHVTGDELPETPPQQPPARRGIIGRLMRRNRLLSDQEADLRARESELLDRLAVALERFGTDADADDLRHFREAREALAGLFLLVIAGEFNSGKSSFINALIGERVLPEGVTPTTDRINLLRHGPTVTETMLEAYLLERTHPASLLSDLSIVDTPGTNAVIREHEELTRDFVPRSDLVLFVTSADRPFTESERSFLEQIRAWGKKVVMVVNKIDLLEKPEEQQQVIAFVRENAETVLGEAPEVFPVSARLAQRAREAGDEAGWQTSGFAAMDDWLVNTLDQQERVRLKLLNPLNVGLRLAGRYKTLAFERLKMLAEDVSTLQNIDSQLAAFHQEMLRDFEPRLGRLDSMLNDMELRGMNFFDDQIRFGKIRSLMRSDQIRRDFERVVVGDTPREIDDEVGRIVDWIVERNLKLWQDLGSYIERRQISRHRDGMIGEVGGGFSYNRQALLDSIGRTSREVVSSYNREAEARKLAEEVRTGAGTTLVAGVGAIGLGTLVATVITGAAADLTGILMATALAVTGLYVIPSKRAHAKKEFSAKITELRTRLKEALTRQVHAAISESTDKVNESIAPYRRFVIVQQDQLNEARNELVTAEDALLRLRSEIEGR